MDSRFLLQHLESRFLLSVVSFREGAGGYVGTQDTELRLDSPSTLLGDATKITVDSDDSNARGNQPAQALIRFDNIFGAGSGQVPSDATILSATLTIYTGTSGSDRSSDASFLHRMLVDWSESSTWNSVGSGISADGSEAAASADSSAVPSSTGSPVNFDVTATVQAWLSNPSANFGWAILPGGNNGWRFDSSEASSVSARPILTIDFQLPATNQPPTVDAGTDQSVTLPASASLDGTVSDDGLPPGSTLTTLWSKADGPGTVSFGDTTAVDTSASFSVDGVYILRLTVSDGEFSRSDEVTITVSPAPGNQPPTVDAGTDQSVTLPSSASLDGTVGDDGLPPGSTLTTLWSKADGPGTVSFGDTTAVDTTASFSVDGIYILRLTVSDGEFSRSDEVTITVSPAAPVNQQPIVDAGADQSVTLPSSASLDGTVSDDGLPAGGTLTTLWSKVSGPGTVTFGNATAIDTTASFSVDGPYVLRLTANDGQLSNSDELTITVHAASSTPVQKTFQNGVSGYAGTQDTHVRLDSPSSSFGNATLVNVDLDDNGASGNQPSQGLIRFDDLFGNAASQIPAGATIVSATLTVITGSSSGDTSSTSSSLYRMLVDWSEASTWNSLSSGISANGTEAASTADGTVTPNTAGGAVNFTVTSTVQAWANNPAANFGWAILPNGTNGWEFNSSEASGVSTRPKLSITYQAAAPTNQAPSVNAGPDQTITLPASASLDGTVSDDGLPSGGTLTTLWSKVSGPGTVTFGNASAIDTTASFSVDGTYVLRLTANDGALSNNDELTVRVDPAPSPPQILNNLQINTDSGEKPQSKVWKHDGQWWGVFANTNGSWVWRLEGATWTAVLKLSNSTTAKADVKPSGNIAHVLLYDGTASQLASIEYVSGSPGTYQFWSTRPTLTNITLTSGVETATIDLDGSGRLWLASDGTTTIEARYSDSPYSSFSAPITLASNINADDISVITSLPNGSVGVLWSNQTTQRYGFRTHAATAAPGTWTADEVPASQSALNIGGGMADDHLNLAVASDGTLYAAVKTSYDAAGQTVIALLIRRPNGNWDNLYTVDTDGTRGIVVLNESANSVMVLYSLTGGTGFGDIVYKQSSTSNISFGPRTTLLSGSLNNVTSTRQIISGEVVIVAADSARRLNGIRTPWPTSAAPASTPLLASSSTSSNPSPIEPSKPGKGSVFNFNKKIGEPDEQALF